LDRNRYSYNNQGSTYSNRKSYEKDFRDNRSPSRDRNRYYNSRNNKNLKALDYDKYIIPDKTKINSLVPYRHAPTEVKQEGSGNIIFNMEGRPIKLFTEEEFRRQLSHSEN
jgi:hypothetical protein